MTAGETEIPSLFEDYRSSLDEGDLPAAVETSVQMDQTSPDINSLLTDFQNAIDDNDTELAQTLLLQLNNAYDERSADEQAEVQRSIAAIEEGNLTESEREDLFNLTKDMAQTKLARSNFLTVAVNYLESDEVESATEVTNTATDTQDAEDSLSTTSESAETVSDSVELDGTPTILNTNAPSEVVPDQSVTMSVTLGNVGDADTGELSIETASSDSVTPVDDSISVGSLSPDNQQDTELEFEVSGDGSVELTVTLREDGTDIESSSQSVSLADTEVPLRQAITGETGTVLNAAQIQQTISLWANNETVPRTGGETVDTDQIQQFITERVEDNGGSQ